MAHPVSTKVFPQLSHAFILLVNQSISPVRLITEHISQGHYQKWHHKLSWKLMPAGKLKN